MAVDTRNKRSSAIQVSLPWRSMLPAPDGAIDQADRQHTALLYAGILATSPTPPTPPTPPAPSTVTVLAWFTLPQYQLDIYSPVTGEILGVLTQTEFEQLSYERLVNDVGRLALTMPYSMALESLFPLDAIIDVRRTSPITGRLQLEESYLLRLTHHFQEGNRETFAIGALACNHLIERRIVDPTDDPLAAGGYSTKAGASDNVIRAYLREQLGDLSSSARRIPNLAVAPVAGTGAVVGARKRYEPLLKTLQDLAERGRMDFNVDHPSSNDFYIRVESIGTDRTRTANYPFRPWVGLMPERGNLSNPSLMVDRKNEQNVVYTLGEGDGANRSVLIMAGTGVADSPLNRIEFTADARSSQKSASSQLLTDAYAALNEKQITTEFTFEPMPTASGSVYQLDWFLGDRVTVGWGNVEKDVRVMGVEVRIDSGGEDIRVAVRDVATGT